MVCIIFPTCLLFAAFERAFLLALGCGTRPLCRRLGMAFRITDSCFAIHGKCKKALFHIDSEVHDYGLGRFSSTMGGS
jgi:hypothetical protein